MSSAYFDCGGGVRAAHIMAHNASAASSWRADGQLQMCAGICVASAHKSCGKQYAMRRKSNEAKWSKAVTWVCTLVCARGQSDESCFDTIKNWFGHLEKLFIALLNYTNVRRVARAPQPNLRRVVCESTWVVYACKLSGARHSERSNKHVRKKSVRQSDRQMNVLSNDNAHSMPNVPQIYFEMLLQHRNLNF